MAGQDELVYRIVFTADETSLKEVQDQVNAIQQTISQAKPGEGGIGSIAIDAKASVTSLVQLDKQIKNTRGELKLLDAQRKVGVQLTDEQLDQEQKLKVELKATTQAYNRQTQSLASIASANNVAATTYNELVARNKALSAELRDLPLDDTTGRLAELQAEYARNNERLKEFDRTMGNHQRNVGNYERALQGVTISAQKMGGSIKGLGFNAASFGMNALSQATRSFQPIADGIADSFTRIGQVATTFLQRLQSLSGAFNLIKQGEFRAAFDLIRDGLTDAFNAAVNTDAALLKLLATQKEIEVEENKLIVTRAKSNAQLAESKLIAMDANVPIEDRIKALEDVLAEEERVAKLEMDNAIARADNLQAIADLDVNSREKARQAAEARAQVYQLEEQSINRRREAQEKLNTLTNEQEALDEQAAADRIASYEAVADSAIKIGNALFEDSKAVRVAEALMDTYRGATSAFADTPGGIAIKSLAASAAVVAGLANVRKIMKAKPGSSTSGGASSSPTISNIPSRSPGGEPTGMTGMGSMYAPGNVRAGEVALQTAGALDAFANRGAPMINVEAKVDREGMAIAVREGEQGLLNQTITYQ